MAKRKTQSQPLPPRYISLEKWLEEGEMLFGSNKTKWKFVCTNCGHVQTAEDFKAINIDPEGHVHFSCIGRWIKSSGTLFDKKSPCNYTLGGFFCFAKTYVGENKTPVFEFARE